MNEQPGRRLPRVPHLVAHESMERPARLKVLEYELGVVRTARGRIAHTFAPDRSVPEAETALAALDALTALAERRLEAVALSCVREGHIWGMPQTGSERVCLVCGTHEPNGAAPLGCGDD